MSENIFDLILPEQSLLDIINGNIRTCNLFNKDIEFYKPLSQSPNIRASDVGMVVYYSFSDLNGATAADLSLYGNDGTVYGREETDEEFYVSAYDAAIELVGARLAREAAGEVAKVHVVVTEVKDILDEIYIEGVDYTVDYTECTVTALKTGGMTVGPLYYITYNYYTFSEGPNRYALDIAAADKITCDHDTSINFVETMTEIVIANVTSSGYLAEKQLSHYIYADIMNVPEQLFTPTAYNVPVELLPAELSKANIYDQIVTIAGSVIPYAEHTDYHIDHIKGTITILSWGSMETGIEYKINYNYYLCTARIYHDGGPTDITAGFKPGWNHIAVTYDKNRMHKQFKLYVDGLLKGSHTFGLTLDLDLGVVTNDAPDITDNVADLVMGRDMVGSLDEIMIYNKPLSYSEIRAHYLYRDDKSQTSTRSTGSSPGDVSFEGNVSITPVEVAGYALLPTDYILDVSYTLTGECTITVPVSECYQGRVFGVKDSGGNAFNHNIRIAATGGQTFDGEAFILIRDSYRGLMFYCNGGNFLIMSMK